MNPTTQPSSWELTEEIPSNATAEDIHAALRAYYYDNFGGNEIEVTSSWLDEDDNETTDEANVATYLFTIRVIDQVDGFSVSAVTPMRQSGKALIKTIAPQKGIKSSPIPSGDYTLSCAGPSGVAITSDSIHWNSDAHTIKTTLEQSIPFLMGKINVEFDKRYRNRKNGLSFYVQFDGLNYQPECDIQPSSRNPLKYNRATKSVNNIRNYAESLYFEPIPIAFLR